MWFISEWIHSSVELLIFSERKRDRDERCFVLGGGKTIVCLLNMLKEPSPHSYSLYVFEDIEQNFKTCLGLVRERKKHTVYDVILL